MVRRRKCRRNGSNCRADITKIKHLSLECNQCNFQVQGVDFGYANNGAGILTLIDDCIIEKDIRPPDRNELVYSEFGSVVKNTAIQTFIFAPEATDWQAGLSLPYKFSPAKCRTDGNKSKMLELTYTIYTDNPKINQKQLINQFYTFKNELTGRFNNVEIVNINITLIDQRESDKSDTTQIQTFDKYV